MRALIFAILLQVVVLTALRFGLTPWHLLSPKEYVDLQTKIARLEQEISEAKKVAAEAKKAIQAHQEKVTSGAWMRDGNYRSALDKGASTSPLLPVKPK